MKSFLAILVFGGIAQASVLSSADAGGIFCSGQGGKPGLTLSYRGKQTFATLVHGTRLVLEDAPVQGISTMTAPPTIYYSLISDRTTILSMVPTQQAHETSPDYTGRAYYKIDGVSYSPYVTCRRF